MSLCVFFPWVLLFGCFVDFLRVWFSSGVCSSLVGVVALYFPGLWFVVLFLALGFFLLLYLQHSYVGVFIFLMVQCDSCGFLVFHCVGSLILKLSYML